MHFDFFTEHKNNRVQKIISIYGSDWFKGKSILELGACHGDIGIEFIKLGAEVTFCDIREENLNEIRDKITNPNIIILNQNRPYNLKTKFDLVLHLGTLWHLENWYNDLYYAMQHSDQMILETKVLPKKGNINLFSSIVNERYSALNTKEPMFTSDAIEERLKSLNLAFKRFDDNDLNTDYLPAEDNVVIKHVYDWTDELHSGSTQKVIHHRRFYLVTKGQ
jgi:hypothetical protein